MSLFPALKSIDRNNIAMITGTSVTKAIPANWDASNHMSKSYLDQLVRTYIVAHACAGEHKQGRLVEDEVEPLS